VDHPQTPFRTSLAGPLVVQPLRRRGLAAEAAGAVGAAADVACRVDQVADDRLPGGGRKAPPRHGARPHPRFVTSNKPRHRLFELSGHVTVINLNRGISLSI